MAKRLFIAVVCLLTLPAFTSSSFSGSETKPSAFKSCALAGHVVGSNAYCNCGCPLCVCDGGDVSMPCDAMQRSKPRGDAKPQAKETQSGSVDYGVPAMAIVMLVILSLRFRA